MQTRSPPPETREEAFERYKTDLEAALIAGNSDKIIEGYRNLGQHFMQGKSVAEHQAAKQMFEKALEHAGVVPITSPQLQRAPPQEAQSRDSPSPSSGGSSPPPRPPPIHDPAPESDGPPAHPGPGPRTVILTRRPLPGMQAPPDGLVG